MNERIKEQAFPNYKYDVNDRGMTLRDYFAAKAMQGMLASGNLPKSVKDDELSVAAYNLANAMMKAREL